MAAYLLKRLLLIIPTMLGIMLISFAIIQVAPGGPVERMIAQLTGTDVGATARIGGQTGDSGRSLQQGGQPGADSLSSKYRGAQGLDPEFIKQLEKQFGFDKPAHERFFLMMMNYLKFDFGKSYFRDTSVLQLIKEKLPVSISLGIWMTLITYLISIPLGIRKAVRDGEKFDTWTSGVLVVGYAIPGFLFAVLLIVMLAGGSFFQIFPLRGLTSASWQELPQFIRSFNPGADPSAPPWSWLPWYWKVFDYFWHLTLPIIAMALGAFTTMTFLTKNSFLDEIRKQYVLTARSKGLAERQVLYGHVFRNAMLLIIAGFPGAFISSFFTGALLIETIFSLDGLGLLSFDSIINRDYPVVFANLYIFSLLGLVVNLVSDFVYTLVDPRIDFESREV
ncbi:MAG: microcin C ABC transporter permease YejB [Hyphomicrobiaceae bacterium]